LSKKEITHDTKIFTFELPEDMCLGLNVGNHIAIQYIKTNSSAFLPTKEFPDGEEISRKYTPISDIHVKGSFDILIKIYRKDTHPEYPEGGLLTQHLDSLELGSMIRMRGPIGRLMYYGNGHFKYR
jgi:NAD(P)H-flavin reductase